VNCYQCETDKPADVLPPRHIKGGGQTDQTFSDVLEEAEIKDPVHPCGCFVVYGILCQCDEHFTEELHGYQAEIYWRPTSAQRAEDAAEEEFLRRHGGR
jgi:hypothetical protein